MSKTKHPFDRRVFFVQQRDEFLSLNDVREYVQTGKLTIADCVFDVDGCSYIAGNIALGKSPKWALSAEHDPMLHGLPTPTEEDVAVMNEILAEEDFLEMPREPKAKTVKDYLAREPRIAHMISTEYCTH